MSAPIRLENLEAMRDTVLDATRGPDVRTPNITVGWMEDLASEIDDVAADTQAGAR